MTPGAIGHVKTAATGGVFVERSSWTESFHSKGGTNSTGETPSTSGTSAPLPCTSSVDFVALASKTANHNCVDIRTNMCGISGAFYADGDTACSLTSPSPMDAHGGAYESPCTTASGCCIAGVTTEWTDKIGTMLTYKEWRAGLAVFALASERYRKKSAYADVIKGTTFKVSGFTSGHEVHVGVSHSEMDTTPPIVRETVPGTWSVRFTDA